LNGLLSEVAAAMVGRLNGADRSFKGVSIDSRTLKPGELFIALRGPHFDGHVFVASAAGRGAAGAVVEKACDAPIAQIVVGDSVAALAALARVWRERSAATVIGVGGSNGKTTTKELLASILAGAAPTLATRGNLNNHFGVPLTLLRLEPGHRFAVIEMGANHPGEIAALAAIAQPAIALVTNAGDEHLEGFGDLAGVAQAEGEMFAALGANGVAVINADDPFCGLWQKLARSARQVHFGIESAAEVHATNLQGRIESGAFVTAFTLSVGDAQARVRLKLAGRHNVINALGAAAAAHAAGVSLPVVVAGLERVNPVNGRLQLRAGPRGSWLIDDSYNANPSSVRAGIDVLCSLPGEHWLVLGAMAELGLHTEASHTAIGDYARSAGVTRLFAMGAAARHAVAAFGSRGNWFEDGARLADAVEAGLETGVTVLIKGSRVNRLELVVDRLMQPLAAAGNGN